MLLSMASLIVVAISPWTAWSPSRTPDYYGWNLFSYFTVLSNFIAAAVYVLAAIILMREKRFGRWFDYARGGAVLYLLVTGIVYAVLLQGSSLTGFDWTNFLLHQFGPVFILAWWLLWPSLAVSPRQSWWWLLFPLAWTIYTLIRSTITHWYPYDFLNPAKNGGWGGVIVYGSAIILLFIVLSQLLAWVSRQRNYNNSPFE